MKNYAPNDGDQRGYGWGYLAHEAKDDKIPAKPTATRKADVYKFEASAFASPAGQKPAALEWRVGRVGKRGWYELDEHWRKEIAEGRAVDIPAEVFAENRANTASAPAGATPPAAAGTGAPRSQSA